MARMGSGQQGSGVVSSDQCQLRRGSGAVSADDLGPQKRQCVSQPGMELGHQPYHSLPLKVSLFFGTLLQRDQTT